MICYDHFVTLSESIYVNLICEFQEDMIKIE